MGMHQVLNDQVGADPDEDQPDHDFDIIQHDRCNYEDNGKGLNIDVDKILESTQDEIADTVKATVDEIDEALFKRFGSSTSSKEESEKEEKGEEVFFEPINDVTNDRDNYIPRV